jgi:hypothetical protein
VYSSGFDPKQLQSLGAALASVKVPTIEPAKLALLGTSLASVKVPTIEPAKLALLGTSLASVKLPTIEPAKLSRIADTVASVQGQLLRSSRLTTASTAFRFLTTPTRVNDLFDGYRGTTGTRLDALGTLRGSLQDTPLMERLDDVADALGTPGGLRWNYEGVAASARGLVEDFQELEPHLQAELEHEAAAVQEALNVSDSQINRSFDLIGLRDELKSYGAFSRTPLAVLAGMIVGGGWYLFQWGSPGEAISQGATTFVLVRGWLGKQDPDARG